LFIIFFYGVPNAPGVRHHCVLTFEARWQVSVGQTLSGLQNDIVGRWQCAVLDVFDVLLKLFYSVIDSRQVAKDASLHYSSIVVVAIYEDIIQFFFQFVSMLWRILWHDY